MLSIWYGTSMGSSRGDMIWNRCFFVRFFAARATMWAVVRIKWANGRSTDDVAVHLCRDMIWYGLLMQIITGFRQVLIMSWLCADVWWSLAERFRDGFALVDIASGRQNIKESYLKTIISFQKIKDSRYIHSNFSKRHYRSARNSTLALHFMENSAFDEMDAKPAPDTNPKRSTTPLGL